MDKYSYWRNALAGTFGPVHDGDPQAGFYRARNKAAGKDDPVAIWFDEAGSAFAVRWKEPVSADEIWTHACKRPISEEVYRGVIASGHWPDDIEVMIGSNNPPDAEAEADEIQSAIDAALAELAKPAETQTDCDRLANHRDRLAKLYKAQEQERKEKKQPHMDAAKAVDEAFKPVLSKIEEAGNKIKKAITAWLLKEEGRRRAEALEQMKKDEEARKAAAAANQPAPEPAPVPEVERPKAGTTGRSTALRTYKSAVITDYAAALKHFAETPEIKEVIQQLANRAARAGVPVPGCDVKEERYAA
jgi:hypothetical protein